MKYLISIILIIPTYCFGQIIGNAYLNGQADHSGIKVKFEPSSPSGQLDSTYTSQDGSYSILIPGGIYFVQFSKQGYFPNSYNNGSPNVISTSDTLMGITLDSIGSNIIYTSGTISGLWSNQNTYIIDGDIIVAQNTSLIIEQGTNIYFNGDYSIDAFGDINFNGSDQNPINISSNYQNPAAGDWNGIRLRTSNSSINYSVFNYCDSCVSFYDVSPDILNSEFKNFKFLGIKAIRSNSKIINNELHSFEGGAIQTVDFSSYSNVNIECNYIHDGYRGIRSIEYDTIINNRFENLSHPNVTGSAISITYDDKILIENNIFKNCELAVGVEAHSLINSTKVVNNIIDNCEAGIRFYGGTTMDIIGNIIMNCDYGISRNWSSDTLDISYNLFFNNISDLGNVNNIIGIGQTVSNNINGDPCDPYLNLFQDPLIANFSNYTLQSTSPCINAGSPNYYQNIGIDHNAICNSVTSIPTNHIVSQSISLFPNPVKDEINFSFNNPDNSSFELKIIDLNGVTLRAISTNNNNINFNIPKLKSGLYFYELKSDSGTHRGKFIKE